MQPGERIAVIKRIATRPGAEDDWSEIDLTLEQGGSLEPAQFGFETWDQWDGTKEAYIQQSIKRAPDDMLAAIDQYLMGHSSPDEEPLEDDRFRLFITHVAKHKLTAHELKSFLPSTASMASLPTRTRSPPRARLPPHLSGSSPATAAEHVRHGHVHDADPQVIDPIAKPTRDNEFLFVVKTALCWLFECVMTWAFSWGRGGF